MTINTLATDAEMMSRLRQMAEDGGTVADLVAYLRGVFSGPDVSFPVVRSLWRAFHLSIVEARLIEGSVLVGGTLRSVEETEALIRPLIDRNRELWRA